MTQYRHYTGISMNLSLKTCIPFKFDALMTSSNTGHRRTCHMINNQDVGGKKNLHFTLIQDARILVSPEAGGWFNVFTLIYDTRLPLNFRVSAKKQALACRVWGNLPHSRGVFVDKMGSASDWLNEVQAMWGINLEPYRNMTYLRTNLSELLRDNWVENNNKNNNTRIIKIILTEMTL